MPVLNETSAVQNMVTQLRLLNPDFSAEIGTPERLIIEALASLMINNQIDLVGLENALNLDTKFGANLDNFVKLFGFARKESTPASGFVVFGRPEPSPILITVPAGTGIQSRSVNQDTTTLQFFTTGAATIPINATESAPVPILAAIPGSVGNLPAGSIKEFSGENLPFGVSTVNNPTATSGGADQEDDNSLKVRFKNTVFRNLAGTEDQYLALAISTAYSTKANVVGPVSQYQEFIQVPDVPDSGKDDTGGGGEEYEYSGVPPRHLVTGTLNGKVFTSSESITVLEKEIVYVYKNEPHPINVYWSAEKAGEKLEIETSTTGTAINFTKESTEAPAGKNTPVIVAIGGSISENEHKWTSSLSTITYAKYLWESRPVFLSNGQTGITNYFFRPGVDFEFNFTPKVQGDTLRFYIDNIGIEPKATVKGLKEPNITFTNVYTGGEEAVQAVTPEQVMLVEYSYTSTASRNDPTRNILNCVDVFVDGENPQATSSIFLAPVPILSKTTFSNTPKDYYYYENYRRDGEPTKRPLIGNYLVPLLQQPITELPSQIKIGSSNYYLGTHYWLVKDISELEGTIRARSGIEWSSTIAGSLGQESNLKTENEAPVPAPESRPPVAKDPSLKDPPEYEGKKFSSLTENETITVENYSFDKNISDLQASIENVRQITTDVLAHSARKRYFKLDVTMVYQPNIAVSTVNNNTHNAIEGYFREQSFGSILKLSDLIRVIHNVPGTSNVRWSADILNPKVTTRVYETDIHGIPLAGASMDRLRAGNASVTEQQQLYITGKPTSGIIVIIYYEGGTEKTIELKTSELTAATIKTKLNAVLTNTTSSVTEDSRVTEESEVPNPIKSFTITFSKKEKQNLPTIYTKNLTAEEHLYSSDIYLKDDELPFLPTGQQRKISRDLPGDVVPGFIIRPRSQGGFERGD